MDTLSTANLLRKADCRGVDINVYSVHYKLFHFSGKSWYKVYYGTRQQSSFLTQESIMSSSLH